jgi:ubiquitin C-terminal hydrolase
MEQAVGFNNTGVICWFNSLLQSLLSSTYFVKAIMLVKTEDVIINSIQHLIHDINSKRFSDFATVYDSSTILRALLRGLQAKDSKRFSEFATGQQSASEGFTLLLDCLDIKSLNTLFTHKYEERVVAQSNPNQVESKVIGYNNQFMVFDEAELKSKGLTEYLKYHEHPLDEYKSEKKDADPNEKYNRLYILRFLPKILVILLNRYHKRDRDISLSAEIKIPSCQFDGFMIYKKIAEIDHMGSLGGGHYVAKVNRNNKEYLCNDNQIMDYRLSTSPNTYMTFYEYNRDELSTD